MTPFSLTGFGNFAKTGALDWIGYLHGFRSSPSSIKAVKTAAQCERAGVPVWVPQLPASPADAIDMIRAEVDVVLSAKPDAQIGFVGSSLGGFYATIMAEELPLSRTVLLNPATRPDVSLRDQLGKKQVYFSDEEIEFLPAYLQQLEDMRVVALTNPDRYLLLAARDDETLVCDDMLRRYPDVHTLLIKGSDHAISDYDDWLPFVATFLGLA